jgi:hypothetical protein
LSNVIKSTKHYKGSKSVIRLIKTLSYKRVKISKGKSSLTYYIVKALALLYIVYV